LLSDIYITSRLLLIKLLTVCLYINDRVTVYSTDVHTLFETFDYIQEFVSSSQYVYLDV